MISSPNEPSGSAAAVEVKGIARTFGGRAVLEDITLSIPRGELFGLLGPSGSGKTTLIKLMTGIDRADAGTVSMLGEPIPQLKMLKAFGYMAQSDALYNELTGKQNLAFFGAMFGLKGARAPSSDSGCFQAGCINRSFE